MPKRRTVPICLVLFVIITIYTVRNHHRNEAADQKIGRHTTQQMIDLSIPICRAILPDQDPLYISAEPTAIAVPGQRARVRWDLTVADSHDNQLLYIVRDDESSQVQRISRVHFPNETPLAAHTPALTAAKAITNARAWLRTIGYQAKWQVVGRPQLEPMYWHIQLSNADRQASMNLDPRRGYLIFVEITPGKAKTF